MLAAVLAVLAAEAMFVGAGELRAPWSGTARVASACMLVAVGLVAGLRGVLVAATVATASLVGSTSWTTGASR